MDYVNDSWIGDASSVASGMVVISYYQSPSTGIVFGFMWPTNSARSLSLVGVLHNLKWN